MSDPTKPVKMKTFHIAMPLLIGLLVSSSICSCKKDDESGIIKDGNGNIYNSITIGTQVWLKENLRTTIYNDGSKISGITDPVIWKTAYKPAYCWYDNDSLNNKNTYGALYNLYAVNSRMLCPDGWHVPDNSEWVTLLNFLGGESSAGNELKEMGTAQWLTSNSYVTNSTDFTALPGGLRGIDGSFLSRTYYGYWWSSGNSTAMGTTYGLTYENGNVYTGQHPGIIGASVRCIQDK